MAGPLVAACVVLPRYCYLPGVRDSKSLSPSQREKLYQKYALPPGYRDRDGGGKIYRCSRHRKSQRFVFQEAIYRASSSRFPEFLILDWVKSLSSDSFFVSISSRKQKFGCGSSFCGG